MALDVSGTSGPLSWNFHGFDEADRAIERLGHEMPEAGVAILTELGLLFEHHVKRGTRVDTGRARASWGHYTPGDIRDPRAAGEAARAAVWEPPTKNNLEVTVGTRVVYVPYLNYRLGDHMVEKAMQEVINQTPSIVNQYLRKVPWWR